MTRPAEVKDYVNSLESISDSLYIMCSSFEDRSIFGLQRLLAGYRVTHSIICRAIEYTDKGRSSEIYEAARERLNAHSSYEPLELKFHMEDPIGLVQQLIGIFSDTGITEILRNITVDITTFPRQHLLLLLRFLDNNPQRGRIQLLYSEPAKYATEMDNAADHWLTRGVTSVHSVPGFSGVQYPRLGKLLVIIEGHEGERTHITLRRHQPDKVILVGQSDVQFHAGLREIAEAQNRDLIALYGAQSLWTTRLPAHGVEETAREIGRIHAEFRHEYNIFIAPFGTKLQLLGTYLAARELTDVQITYASAAVHNWRHYSTGAGRLWQMELEPLQSR